MKNLWLIFFLCLIARINYAQCPEGDIHLTSQLEVDSFLIKYPNCKHLQGKFIIGYRSKWQTGLCSIESDITDLSSIQGIESIVNDSFIIECNPMIITLDGFENIDSIKRMKIDHNRHLSSIDAFYNLRYVDRLSIGSDSTLLFVKGFSSLDSVSNLSLEARNNSFLSAISLPKLTKVKNIYIRGNIVLDSFYRLTEITKSINITSRPVINDMKFLENIKWPVVGKDLLFFLQDIDTVSFDGLEEVEYLKSIWFNNCTHIDMQALHNIKKISGEQLDFLFSTCQTCTNLDFMTPILHALSEIEILNIYSLQSLDGLEQLNADSMTSLTVRSNWNLTDISAISHLKNISQLELSYNKNLEVCHYPSICRYLELPESSNAIITDNAPGCNSRQEILDQCASPPEIVATVHPDYTWYEVLSSDQWSIAAPSITDYINVALHLQDDTTGHYPLYLRPTQNGTDKDTKYWLSEAPLGKVYLGHNQDSTLLYDFTAEVGDTIFSNYYPHGMVVQAKEDYQLYDGSLRPALQLTCADDGSGQTYAPSYWISGIGDKRGLTAPIYACHQAVAYQLLCFYDADTLRYQLPGEEDCYYEYVVHTQDPSITTSAVYPNPTTGLLTTADYVTSATVYNSLGMLVIAQTTDHQLDLSHAPTGIYFVATTNQNGKTAWVKVVKVR